VKCRNLSVCFLVLLAACGSGVTDTTGTIEQRYLFEVEHVNHAWGLFWRGLVIDREGDIYAYDLEHGAWERASADWYTESELEDKYGHEARYVGRIDEATIVQQFGRIEDVGVELPAPQHVCADAGSFTYRAFRYESDGGRYHPLLLRQEGDLVQVNTSDAAEDLAAWLRNLVLALENAGITPFNQGLCTP
jgi:hypothetical protein